jgi:hypothetical protein
VILLKNDNKSINGYLHFPMGFPSLASLRRMVFAPCTLLCTGSILVLIGLLCYSVLHDYISAQIRAGVLAYAVLSSPTAGQWKGFVDSRDPSGPAVVSVFYFYDVLNPEEVVGGGKPNVRTVGPLTYNYVNTKHDIFQTETISYEKEINR